MIIKIKVIPNSKNQEIKRINSEKYIINLKQSPENNKANFELIKLLRNHFNKNIKIIRGLKSKNKIIQIENANKI